MAEPETTPNNMPHAAEPTDEHRWLQRLVGEWVYEVGMPAEPGQPAETLTGEEVVRPLGDLWVIAEGRGVTPDGEPVRSVMTLGFDPGRGRFVGTWIGSTMTHLWVYDGELDAAGDQLILHATGPDMESPGETRPYQDIITFVDDDHRLLTPRMQRADGEWQDLMKASYRRKG